MRDWEAYVRRHLRLPDLAPAREARIVRELAAQLQDFHLAALARGLREDEADAHARAQIQDWLALARDLREAERPHVRPRLERLNDRIDGAAAAPQGGARMLGDLLRDVRYAFRQLAATPGFTAVAGLTLALAIGVTTAIFSAVNGVLLRPLPYPSPDDLVRVHETVPQYGRFSVAPATFLDWRQQNTVFERIAALTATSGTFGGADGPERVAGALVSWDLFDLLRVQPVLGRGFTEADDAPGRDTAIVLSHGMWQRRFGGDPGVLGRAVPLGGQPMTIVGVMPAGFAFPAQDTEYWKPLAIDPSRATRGGHYLAVVARLAPGVELRQASAEMRTISERLARQYPEASANESAEVVALHESIVGRVRPALLTLLAAVGIVVLIACANVAHLLLVRAGARAKEMAIRAALGASSARLARQMLVESVLLALPAGALGLALAYAAIAPLQSLAAGSVPRVHDVTIDGTVLGFSFLLAVSTGVVFGFAPAWQASRPGAQEALKEGARSTSLAAARWVRSGLPVLEVALSIVLLVGAALLLRSFVRVAGVDPGFRADNVLAFRVSLERHAYPEDARRTAFYDALLERMAALPGVREAGMAQTLPLRGDYVLSFTIDGRPAPPGGAEPSANYRSIGAGYFQALGIPLRRGRLFAAGDDGGAPKVAIVDEAFARRHFPAEDPLGRRIDIGNGTDGFYEIVGVVGDVRHEGLDASPEPTMYVPFAQDVFSTMWIVARADGEPGRLAPAVRGVVRGLDPAVAPYSLGPLAEAVSASVAERRFSMLLLLLFAVSALFLAAVGLYGVMAYGVSQRTREFGVRVAMGARPSDLSRMVLAGGLKLALAGVAIGLGAALALARLLSSMLFGVTPFDPASYLATSAVLLGVAALACYVPARRATRLDPIVALRQ